MSKRTLFKIKKGRFRERLEIVVVHRALGQFQNKSLIISYDYIRHTCGFSMISSAFVIHIYVPEQNQILGSCQWNGLIFVYRAG